MDTRSLIFAIWISSNKSRDDTLTAIESMASGQVSTYIQGGKTMISASVGSESFSYQLSGALSTDAVTQMCYDAWRAVMRRETDSDLQDWLMADDVSSVRIGFSRGTLQL